MQIEQHIINRKCIFGDRFKRAGRRWYNGGKFSETESDSQFCTFVCEKLITSALIVYSLFSNLVIFLRLE
jgi:hypothetical protein